LANQILMSAVYYGNIWRGQDFPFMSQAIFDTNGNQYNQTAILTDGRFDKSKYDAIGPAYFSATNALFLIVDNLSIGAALTGVFLFNWPELKPIIAMFDVRGLKARCTNGWRFFLFGNGEVFDSENHDEHYLKMKAYKPIPQWWFVLLLICAFAMAQATNYAGKSGLPWWALTVILIIAFVFTVVYSFLAAVLGFVQFVSGGTGLYQLLCSKLVPGNPVANMYAAMYGNNPQVQAIALLGDMKLGTYVKIPPRVTFLMQMVSRFIHNLYIKLQRLTMGACSYRSEQFWELCSITSWLSPSSTLSEPPSCPFRVLGCGLDRMRRAIIAMQSRGVHWALKRSDRNQRM
jgi:hypothetical protein